MFAFQDAYKAGLWAPRHWLPNIVAGVIVGVVALPLAMAFAIASGIKPEQGIYTSIIAGIVVALFGGSRVQIAGPTGAFIVILSGIVAEHGVGGLQVATLMAGVMLCAFGLSRMGGVIRYIPLPVILGFTAGIGVIIWVGQWQAFFGLPAVTGQYFHEKLWFLLTHLGQLDLTTTFIGLLSLALVLTPKWVKSMQSIPGPLLALIVAALLQSIFNFKSVATIGTAFGEIPSGLPNLAMPDLSAGNLINLIGPAFTIAMLGAIESLLSAVVADSMAKTRHNSNAELIGQGLANIITPLFGGIAATGAIARTATNIRSGGYAPIAGLVHSAVLILILVLLAPLASYIPLACLAAILFMVAWNMSELKRIRSIVLQAPRADTVILTITLLLTVFADLVVAVNFGIVLAILHFLRRMAATFEIESEPISDYPGDNPAGGHIITIDGPMFFAAVENINRLFAQDQADMVIDFDQVPFADVTALQALDDQIRQALTQNRKIVLCAANQRMLHKLERMDSIAGLMDSSYAPDLPSAIRLLKARV